MFGNITGTKVGQIFADGRHLRAAGIHAPTMAGIWGAQEGAYLMDFTIIVRELKKKELKIIFYIIGPNQLFWILKT